MERMLPCSSDRSFLNFIVENMAAHRTNSLLTILPVALQTGYSEIDPELESLKVQ
jgi:hypothetical protein